MKKLFGVVEIHDGGNGYVSLVMESGTVVHLPAGDHSITVHSEDGPDGWAPTNVTIDYHNS